MNDTHFKIEAMQCALLREAGIVKRTMQMRSLTRAVIRLSRRAIVRAHPEYNQQEVGLFFVRLHYGGDIADHLEKYLKLRKTP